MVNRVGVRSSAMRPLPPWPSVVLAGIAAFGCGAALQVAPIAAVAVPEGVAHRPWVSAQLQASSPVVLRAMLAGPRATQRALGLSEGLRLGLFDAAGLTRAAQGLASGGPSEGDLRWVRFRALRGSASAGWCARGVRVVEAGAEGFAHRAVVIDRLLLVGRESGPTAGLWASWLEGLVVTAEGVKVLPWISWRDAVEAPRRDHVDISLWDCDLAARPAQP